MIVVPESGGHADSANRLSPDALALLARRARLREQNQVYAIGRSPDADRLAPLSSWQESIWFFDQLEPGSDVYNRALRFRLTGPLNVAALQASLAGIFRKHEVLRSRVEVEGGIPYQRVMSEFEFRLPVVDFRSLSPEDHAAQYCDLANAVARDPFDLGTGPWARATLVREADDVHVLLFTAHHIAFDGWSASLFNAELTESYARIVDGTGTDGDELAFQYGDFASWQRGRLGGSALDKELDYWVESLRGAPSLLELPADRARPNSRSNPAGTASLVIPPGMVDRLHELGREENATLFMTVLAAFQLLLVRLSGRDDVVVGIPVAGRASVAAEQVIGCFINVLPMRARMVDRWSFRDLLRDTRSSALGGLAHQDAPFDAIVDRIQPERTLAYTPLTQVLFNFRNTPSAVARIKGLSVEVESVPAASIISDMEVDVEQRDGALHFSVTYSAALFDRSSVERWLGHLTTLLESIIDGPDSEAMLMPLMSALERRRITVDWNAASTAQDYETCLHQLIEAQVRRSPDAIAIRSESETLSYAELDRRANLLAHDLVRRGVVTGALVGVNMERSPDLVVALLAVLKAGGAYVPLDPAYPEDRIAYMLSDSRPAVLVAHRAPGGRETAGDVPVVFVDADYWKRCEGGPVGDSRSCATADSIAYVIYTSGSTGRPKGALNTHRAVCNMLLRGRDTLGFCSSDVTLLLTSVSFDLSIDELFLPLISGGQLALAGPDDAADPASLARTIEKFGVTIFFVVPAVLRLLVDEPDASWRCRSIRAVSAGGEALSHALLHDTWATLNASVFNVYGPSETAVDALLWQCGSNDQHRSIPIGRPILNVRVYILDRFGEPVPIGVSGEIYLGGVCVGAGYLNRPELTEEKFLRDPFLTGNDARMYRTGDLARFDAAGVVEILGRVDHQVKLRGVRIELGEIEAVISSVDSVRECAVIVSEDTPGARELVAYVVAREGATIADSHLRDALRVRLLPAMVPSRIVVMDELPRTPSQKVDRLALPTPAARCREHSADCVVPQTRMEHLIAGIWASVLNASAFGIDDDFFELGGHSLSATRVMSRIRETVSVEASLRLLFEYPTVRALSQAVDNLLVAGQAADQDKSNSSRTIPRSETDSRTPSSGEERLWFLDQVIGASALYNISSALRLTGDVNAGAIRAALRNLVRRHEILRTRYLSDGGALRIVVDADRDVRLEIASTHDWNGPQESTDASGKRGWTAADLNAALAAEAARPFVLERDMLLRAILYQPGPRHHVLQLTTHHIVSDGWSQDLLWQEFGEFYNAEVRGTEAKLPDLPIRYGDYANWMRSPARTAELEIAARNWSERLSGSPHVLELPTDHPRPPGQTYRGSLRSYELSSRAVAGLSAFGRAEHATPFMVVLSALFAVLHRYTGQSRMLVGSPMAARTMPEVKGILGFFANTIVLPGDVSDDPTFRELVAQIRTVALDAYGRQDVPFENIVQRLNPQRDASMSPIVQVMLELDNLAPHELKLDGLETSLRQIHTGTSKFDLTVHATVSEEAGAASVEFNSDLFEPETIDRFWSHLNNFLENAIDRPDDRISTVEFLGAAERRTLLIDWNATAEVYPKCRSLAALVEEQVERTPDGIAVVCGDASLTYRQLNTRANQLAAELVRMGAAPGGAVALCLERCTDMMVTLLAIVKTGAAYVPVDPSSPAERVNYILTDSGAEILVTEKPTMDSASNFAGAVILVDSDGWTTNDRANPAVVVPGDTTAYVIYTSGSTGRPKGVRVGCNALLNLLWSMRARFGLDVTDRVLAVTTIAFDIAGVDIWLPWLVGATTVVADRRAAADGEALATLIERHDITFLQATPTTWWLLFNAGWKGKSKLQGASSGEAITRDVAERAAAGVGRFWNLYGPTETTIWSTGIVVQEPVHPSCVGRPLGNTQCYILDAHRQAQPIGVTGELYIAGDGLADGYQNRPDLSELAFVSNPFSGNPGARMYRTGDLARFLANGNIELVGRADNQIKIRGYRIEPGEIESVLMQHESVRRAVVTARLNGFGERVLVAYVVYGDAAAPLPDLRRILRQSLPEYMIPSAFVALDAIPVTESGKIDLRALPVPETNSGSGIRGSAALDSPTHKLVAEVWTEVLGVTNVGADDDFFELGGHSLLAAIMMARIGELFGTHLPLSVLFEEPTVRHIANSLMRDSATDESLVKCIQRGASDRTPFFFFHGDYAGGGLYCRKLLRYVDGDMPMYVIGPHGAGGPETIESMAADVLPCIRQVQPHGPYLLAGHCNGGVVALELAAQLRDAGEPVEFLAVVDVDVRNVQLAPLYALARRVGTLLGFDQSRQLETLIRLREPALRFLEKELPRIDESSGLGDRILFTRALASLLVRRAVRRAWRAATRTSHDEPSAPPDSTRLSAELHSGDSTPPDIDKFIFRAMCAYVPRYYDTRVTVIGAKEVREKASGDHLRNWRSIARDVEEFVIPGTHASIVTSDIAGLGELLRAKIPRI